LKGINVPNGKLDEAEIRRIVLAAVTAHMKPWGEMLKSLHDWQIGFWSNGSGKPLGFFQMRMREDDARHKLLLDYQEKQTKELERQAVIADKLDDFIKAEAVRKEEEEKHRKTVEKRWSILWSVVKWGGPAVVTAFLALCAWLGPHLFRVTRILVEDYLHYHPSVTERLKDSSRTDDSGVQSHQQAPQTSDSGPGRAH
jgi:hypothetical protein